MQEISAELLERRARELHERKASWHFHILTPGCGLNKSDRFALVLEDAGSSVVSANYSTSAQTEVGKRLAPLLHGADLLDEQAAAAPETNSKIVSVARDLSAAGTPWHHHMLFPLCVFNERRPYWTLLLEAEGQNHEESFDEEPRHLLKVIEKLFYSQAKIS